MANEQNLIRNTSLSTEEARRRGRLGGIKSAESRRAKKNLSERIKLALEISTTENLKLLKKDIRELLPNRDTKRNREELKTLITKAKLIRDCGIDIYRILRIAQNDINPELALRATSALWDREEGKPMQSATTKLQGEVTHKTIFVEEKTTNKLENHIVETINAD